MRIKDENICALAAAKSLDRRGAGVARGGAENGRARIAHRQRVVHQPAEPLHRKVFEGERRAVEKFEQVEIVAELSDRRLRRMAKARVSLVRHGEKLAVGISPATNGFTIVAAASA